MAPKASPTTTNENHLNGRQSHSKHFSAGETMEDRQTGNDGPTMRRNPSQQRASSSTHQHSPKRPQHLQATSQGDQDEVSRLRAELAAAKSEISSLRVELSQQQYELEEVNLIINLQDELRACKQVINQQKLQVEQLILSQQQQQQSAEVDFPSSETSPTPQRNEGKKMKISGAQDWKAEYRALHGRYSELQNNRAWSEFQLRDRICNDSLKYHRRLIHWKSKNKNLEQELAEIKAAHITEVEELQKKWKSTASSVLQHTLKDLKNTQGKVRQLEKELTRIKLEQNEPEIQIQDSSSKFLVKAAKQSNFL